LRLIYLISLDLPEMPKQDLTRQELGQMEVREMGRRMKDPNGSWDY